MTDVLMMYVKIVIKQMKSWLGNVTIMAGLNIFFSVAIISGVNFKLSDLLLFHKRFDSLVSVCV